MGTSVYGVFDFQAKIDETIVALEEVNVSRKAISALFPSPGTTRTYAVTEHTRLPPSVESGESTGALAGGVLGWSIGLGAILIPELLPVVGGVQMALWAGGQVAATLAGAGVGVAIGRAFSGLGIPKYAADKYEKYLKEGRILLAVHCESQEEVSKVMDVLEAHGGKEIGFEGQEMQREHELNEHSPQL